MTWINQQMRCHVLGMSKSEWILSGFGCESNAEVEGWGGASGRKIGGRGCQKWIAYDGKSDQKWMNMLPPFSENLHSLQLWLSNIPERWESDRATSIRGNSFCGSICTSWTCNPHLVKNKTRCISKTQKLAAQLAFRGWEIGPAIRNDITLISCLPHLLAH